jgi:ssDNA-binding Zn-finger/Zn-ribbon topoisomerase 1
MSEKVKNTEVVIPCPNCKNGLHIFVRGDDMFYSECFECRYLPEPDEIRAEVKNALLSDGGGFWDFIIVCSPGDEVICDLCNRTVTPDETGGCFLGSYAVCPTCTQNRLSDESRREAEMVAGSFVEAVYKKRQEMLSAS